VKKDSHLEKSLESLFLSLGMSEKEALVYRLLLRLGKTKVAPIIKGSGLKRGITYAVLYRLEKQGLAKKFEQAKMTFFQAEPPYRLAEQAEKRAKEAQMTKDLIEEVLPSLNSEYKIAIGKPVIRYFEGKEGLVKIFQDIYAPKKDTVWGLCDADVIEETLKGITFGNLIPGRIKNKLQVKVLFSDTPLAKKLHQDDKKTYRESFLIDPKKYPFPAEIEAYENKIALMSFKKGDFLGLIIENEDFATSLRSLLKLTFDCLRRPPTPKKLKH